MLLRLLLVGNQWQPPGHWFSCQMPVVSLATVGRLDQRGTWVNAITFELVSHISCMESCVRDIYWLKSTQFTQVHRRIRSTPLHLSSGNDYEISDRIYKGHFWGNMLFKETLMARYMLLIIR